MTNVERPSMHGVRVFVGGPIQYALGSDQFNQALQFSISRVIAAFERAGATVFSAHVAERFGLDTHTFTPDGVTLRDYTWIRRCDVFVPILPLDELGNLLRTDGTHIELGWASAFQKPIVAVTPLPLSASASHLLKGLPTVARVALVDGTDIEAVVDDVVSRAAAFARTEKVQAKAIVGQ